MANRTVPLEVKEGKGTKRAGRGAATPPPRVEAAGPLLPPETLTGEARAFFERTADLLSRRGQLSLDSFAPLVAMSEVYGERQKHLADLEAGGWTQKVKTGAGGEMERQRPAVGMYQDADRRYRAWMVEFGLTDASRGKVNAVVLPPRAPKGADAGKATPKDPLARYGLN